MADVEMPVEYYTRFDPADEYEEHLFIAGRGVQAAEFNEIQQASNYRVKGIADALLKDGDIIRDASCQVNSSTGAVTCQSGAVYLRGAVRGVAPAAFTIPIEGTVTIGIYLVETVVTAVEDPDLYDPATGTRNYNKAGAARLRVHAKWGWSGDGETGTFYAVYSVTDGLLDSKEPPPNLDAVNQALARYDRDSAGGSYVVSGLTVARLEDRVDGFQQFAVESGRARVNGFAIDVQTSRRLIRGAVPDIRFIDSEPMTSTTIAAQRVNVARAPIANITGVRITAQKTVTINHGTVTGSQDPLPDTSVIALVLVKQGGTTYTAGTDYNLTAGKVDWTPAGAEPAPGSSYDVTYQYITAVTPTAVDDTGFTVTGAVVGSLILTSYNVKLPRIDRLCLNPEGQFVWLTGVSTDYDPVRPPVPSGLLPLAQVVQLWTSASYVINDGVRVLPMQDLQALNTRLDNVVALVAQQKLQADAQQRDAAAKKGMFVDPFLNDDQRDQGVSQTAAIVDGELMLPIEATPLAVSADVSGSVTCAYTSRVVLAQRFRTMSMKINPYMAFGVMPGSAALTPAIDRWTENTTAWTSPVTQNFVRNLGAGSVLASTMATVRTVEQSKSATSSIQNLRTIEVKFRITGFGAGENLSQVTFDGLPVTATSI